MEKTKKPRLLAYLGRFTAVHALSYIVIAILFLNFQSLLPETKRIALDFYEPYRLFDFPAIAGQIVRGVAFALIFYPFYDLIFRNKAGRILLFASMWGLALFGSVEPQPGSVEGIIYTTTPFTEHLFVLIGVGVQMLLFVWIIFKWESYISESKSLRSDFELFPNRKKIKGYTTRFTILHLVTYWVVGSIFYEIAGYKDALESMEVFELWRDLENLPAVMLVFGGQIFRGIFLALLLYPFYHSYIFKKYGWALLYLLLAGLTIFGSPIFLREFFVAFDGTIREFFESLIIGIPEIFSQMLVFSLIFFFWQKRVERKKMVNKK